METAESYTKQRQSLGFWPLDSRNVHTAERIASVALGVATLALGLYRPSPIKTAAAVLLGGALIARGASGKCAAYKALGVDTAHKDVPQPGVGINPPKEEVLLDDMIDDSFPASDPPSHY